MKEAKIEIEKKHHKEVKMTQDRPNTILLKDIPNITLYLPDEIDLNCGIDEPLRRKSGSSFHVEDSQPALLYACYVTDPDLILLLLKFGANPNIVGSISIKGYTVTSYSLPVLAAAILNPRLPQKIIEALLEKGANPGQIDKDGLTILDWAAFDRHSNNRNLLNLTPNELTNKNVLPLLAHLYNICFIEHPTMIASMMSKHINGNVSLDIGIIINDYNPTLPFSSKLIPDTAALQFIHKFMSLLKSAYQMYSQNKKLEQLANLPQDKIDMLEKLSALPNDTLKKVVLITYQFNGTREEHKQEAEKNTISSRPL